MMPCADEYNVKYYDYSFLRRVDVTNTTKFYIVRTESKNQHTYRLIGSSEDFSADKLPEECVLYRAISAKELFEHNQNNTNLGYDLSFLNDVFPKGVLSSAYFAKDALQAYLPVDLTTYPLMKNRKESELLPEQILEGLEQQQAASSAFRYLAFLTAWCERAYQFSMNFIPHYYSSFREPKIAPFDTDVIIAKRAGSLLFFEANSSRSLQMQRPEENLESELGIAN